MRDERTKNRTLHKQYLDAATSVVSVEHFTGGTFLVVIDTIERTLLILTKQNDSLVAKASVT
jgi:hypothetical protein